MTDYDSYPLYTTKRSLEDSASPTRLSHLPALARKPSHAKDYIADPGLESACNVALLLGQPLLLTGEPGTGKTELAKSLAYHLGLADSFHKFETRSSSVASDLFYTHDALKQFHDGKSRGALPYIRFGPLGRAVLYTSKPDAILADPENSTNTGLTAADLWQHPVWLGHFPPAPTRSVVLIDEIDKAPRDFPNDILNEIEHLYFRIPELNNLVVRANPELKPIIIFTSNSEKNLPDAFLRRCVYYDIPFPDREGLERILEARLDIDPAESFGSNALEFFLHLRKSSVGLRKKPSTAELLAWLNVMQSIAKLSKVKPTVTAHGEMTLSTLVKSDYDQPAAKKEFHQWLKTVTGKN